MDVWFDSGSSHTGAMMARGLGYPADLYFEGSDQYRGWFNSSLIVGTAVHGEAPYRQVLSHGFVMDENGEKMSKSRGNSVSPKEVTNKYRCGHPASVGDKHRLSGGLPHRRTTSSNSARKRTARCATPSASCWPMSMRRTLQRRICRAYSSLPISDQYMLVLLAQTNEKVEKPIRNIVLRMPLRR